MAALPWSWTMSGRNISFAISSRFFNACAILVSFRCGRTNGYGDIRSSKKHELSGAGWPRKPMRLQKQNLTDLAVFGGTPAFSDKLHVGRPNIGNRSRLTERIDSILSRRWLSNNGPYVQEFENRISEFVGVTHCVATCNGTVGLEIAIRALGLAGEVIVPSFTFVATAHALQWQNVTPVFCDVDRRTHNIDPHQVQQLITPRPPGITGWNLWVRPC